MERLKFINAIVVAMLVASVPAFAQQHKVKYYSKSGYKEVPRQAAHYVKVIEHKADGSTVFTKFTMPDSVKTEVEIYSDIDGGRYKQGIKDGDYFSWHQNGQVSMQGFFSNDKLEGAYKSWHENGQLRHTMQYKNGALQDTLRAYDEQGRLRRLEVYKDDEMLAGEVYAEDGNVLDYFLTHEMPTFPGGDNMMLRFMSRNIKYPKAAWKAKVSGVVILSFVVQKDGSITDLEVIKGVSPELDEESMHMVQLMPTWEPGKQEGKPVPVRFTLPVQFTIN